MRKRKLEPEKLNSQITPMGEKDAKGLHEMVKRRCVEENRVTELKTHELIPDIETVKCVEEGEQKWLIEVNLPNSRIWKCGHCSWYLNPGSEI